MRFLSTRALRNRPGYVRELAREGDLVLTANGKPVAILVGIEDEGFEETARAVRRAKAQLALSRMRRQAVRRNLRDMPLSAINAEIRAARSRRKVR
jgi:antitoxin (DNA-binding transcriptional repressor) of toxin-antitoxin stability system